MSDDKKSMLPGELGYRDIHELYRRLDTGVYRDTLEHETKRTRKKGCNGHFKKPRISLIYRFSFEYKEKLIKLAAWDFETLYKIARYGLRHSELNEPSLKNQQAVIKTYLKCLENRLNHEGLVVYDKDIPDKYILSNKALCGRYVARLEDLSR